VVYGVAQEGCPADNEPWMERDRQCGIDERGEYERKLFVCRCVEELSRRKRRADFGFACGHAAGAEGGEEWNER